MDEYYWVEILSFVFSNCSLLNPPISVSLLLSEWWFTQQTLWLQWKEFLEKGSEAETSVVEEKINSQKPDECALLIYTVSYCTLACACRAYTDLFSFFLLPPAITLPFLPPTLPSPLPPYLSFPTILPFLSLPSSCLFLFTFPYFSS